MICNVVLLRNHGQFRSRAEVCQEHGKRGWLELRKANPQYWGRSFEAKLLDPRNTERELLPVLQYARVLTIRDGGVAIDGMMITTRGAKSKAIHTRQTWWCVIHHDEAYAALERMDARSSTGFHVNDDD